MYFRQIEREDLSLLREWRNSERVRKNTREYRLLNMLNQEAWWHKVSTGKTDDMFLIEMDRKKVGVCGLTHINWKDRSAEISYYSGLEEKPLRNAMIAIRTYKFLKDKAFKEYGLHRLWGEIYENNEVALKIALKQGLKEEGRLREAYFWDGRYWDSVIVGMLDYEYLSG